MLAVMFSGRHHATKGGDGRYFIDRDGTHFRYILNYLRDGNTYIPVDSQQVIDGRIAGKNWASASNRDCADFWELFWRLTEDVGDGVKIVKVKAHVSFPHASAGLMRMKDWCGRTYVHL